MAEPGFNPCFSGTRARTQTKIGPSRHFHCFNPCFSGTRARTCSRRRRDSIDIRFQSLFFWNSRPDSLNVLSVPFMSYCFNPCFSGTRARTTQGNRGPETMVGFNPCFSGTRARTGGRYDLGSGEGRFQSLFFWNSRPDNRSRSSGRSTPSFNPCFSGTRARTIPP